MYYARKLFMRFSLFTMRALHVARLLFRNAFSGGRENRNVRVIVINNDRVLLIKHVLAPGVWTLPGGSVEFGESDETAAIREVKEETGFEISLLSEIGTYERRVFGVGDIVRVFYTSTPAGTMNLLPNREILQRGHFSVHELPDTVSPKTKRVIEAYLRGARGERGVW